MKVTLAHRVTPTDDVLFQEVGGEAVLLNLASECYFGLDPVGTRAWTLLAGGSSLQAVFESMLTEFDVAPEQLEGDLIALVQQLAENGLVRVE